MPLPKSSSKYLFDSPKNYRICVHGLLEKHWSERLGGLHITTTRRGNRTPETTLTGAVVDQAALVGILNTLYELHLPLLSVEHLEGDDCEH